MDVSPILPPFPSRQSEGRRAFEVDDLFLHRRPSMLHGVPGIDTVACAVRCIDRDEDAYVSRIWRFALDGSGGAQLTRGAGSSDSSPRWSDDGTQLAFLSDRGGGPAQLYLMPRDEAGEARQVGRFEQSVSCPRWHPDGQRLVVAATLRVDPDLRGRRSDRPAAARGPHAPEVAWRLPYKEDGTGYMLAREIHLFSVDTEGGEQRQLTDGPFDVLSHDISRDGLRIAYARTREGRFAHASDLWICDDQGGQHHRCTFEHAMVMQPVWSPDGRFIAFCGAQEEGDAEPRLWLHEVASGRTTPLGDVDVADPESLHWDADGTRLVFVRAHRGRHQVATIDVPHGRSLQVLVEGDRQIGAFCVAGDRLVFGPEHPSLASELHACDADGSGELRISDLNPWWRERLPVTAQARLFRVPDGQGGTEEVEGWLVQADDAQAPMPLLDAVHGGPASYAAMSFDTNVFWLALCARGWSVLALNAVGSASYGREFCHRLAGHWGEMDLPQHLAAIAQLQAEGHCDQRLAIAGQSYGGYLAAWSGGQTDVFRAAVVMAPVGNVETHYGTSDGGFYTDPFYMDSQPAFDRARARDLSPLHHIERSTTPTLFLQGKDDERCPKCQSEELFVTLARAGDTPTELVLYPGGSHSFLASGQPSTQADGFRRIVDWLQAHAGEKPQRHAAPVAEQAQAAPVEDALLEASAPSAEELREALQAIPEGPNVEFSPWELQAARGETPLEGPRKQDGEPESR